ncbi:8130_t:CDS:1 [Scutellospora calospora]|uniref:8130_t:CDS:1 n=1 Tax=Scutellospora calospora TaxID=85575 RepID=A0ACA9JWP4_9GLOM|nr:8130_t:CDS:1 [Scutellospora calospora]
MTDPRFPTTEKSEKWVKTTFNNFEPSQYGLLINLIQIHQKIHTYGNYFALDRAEDLVDRATKFLIDHKDKPVKQQKNFREWIGFLQKNEIKKQIRPRDWIGLKACIKFKKLQIQSLLKKDSELGQWLNEEYKGDDENIKIKYKIGREMIKLAVLVLCKIRTFEEDPNLLKYYLKKSQEYSFTIRNISQKKFKDLIAMWYIINMIKTEIEDTGALDNLDFEK